MVYTVYASDDTGYPYVLEVDAETEREAIDRTAGYYKLTRETGDFMAFEGKIREEGQME